jgi:hypothetical protein
MQHLFFMRSLPLYFLVRLLYSAFRVCIIRRDCTVFYWIPSVRLESACLHVATSWFIQMNPVVRRFRDRTVSDFVIVGQGFVGPFSFQEFVCYWTTSQLPIGHSSRWHRVWTGSDSISEQTLLSIQGIPISSQAVVLLDIHWVPFFWVISL